MITTTIRSRTLKTAAAAAALFITGLAAPAMAQPSSANLSASSRGTASVPAAAETTQRRPQMICARTEIVGSRIARQVCHTRDQWLALEGFVPGERRGR